MKRKLSLLLAVVMILGSFSFAYAAEDFDAAEFLEEVGVLKGDTSGDLMEDEALLRRDSVVLLSRLMGAEDVAEEFPVTEELPSFEDITDNYYAPYLAWAESNGYIVGKAEGKFGFNDNLTTKEYSVVLLRALEYVDEAADWDAVFETAEELGLLEDVETEADEEFTRADMAQMTVNALGVKIKDSELTLAEKLEIEMPEPEVLEVEEVFADNLKEIKVVFNKDVDEELVDLDLYETDAGDLDHVFVEDGNVLVLTLEKAMKNKKEYELTIEGTEEVNGDYEFTAYDNAVPEVVEVVGLGTKAVKVVMSEPVEDAKSTNFRLDGKTAYGKPHTAGREIILKVYSDLEIGDHELTVRNLEDFAEYKSLETTHAFEVVEDKDAPTVVDVEAPSLEKVIVTFDEDVDQDTVNKKTVYHKSSGSKIYSDDYKALAGNKFAFEFPGEDKGLPIHETTIYVEGVKDYSGNKMKPHEALVKPGVDTTRPEIVDYEVSGGDKVITLKFSKKVNLKDAKFTLLDEDDDKLYITKETVEGKLVKLTVGEALAYDEEYTLKVAGVRDTNKYPNYMADTTLTISASDVGAPELTLINIKPGNEEDDTIPYTVTLSFNKTMDLDTVSNPENYTVELDNDSIQPLTNFDNEIDIKDSDGRKVEIKVYVEKKSNDEYPEVVGIAGLDLKAYNGKTISNYGRIERKEEKQDIELTTATAIAIDRETIEVEFNNNVVKAPKDAFEFNGSNGSINPEKVSIDGKVVTLTFDEDTISVDPEEKAEKLEIVDNKVEGRFDQVFKGKTINVLDKIAPSINKVSKEEETTSGSAVTFDLKVKFDEKLNFLVDADAAVKSDLEVKRLDYSAKIADYDIKYNNGQDTITITITYDKGEIDDDDLVEAYLESEYEVKVKGNGIIQDEKGNYGKSEKISGEDS